MRTHTNAFKQGISKNGRQINGKIYLYNNYIIATEDSNIITTESNERLISEQTNNNEKYLITNELIYSIKFLKNGNLLQSLMKQVNLELKYELEIGSIINVQFGLLVNNSYEFLNYGNYVVYSKEYNANNETWDYVCYDKMLYSMISYRNLNISYPCNIKQYITAIAEKIGLIFANLNENFTNYDQIILSNLFRQQNVTYRDILDKLSEIVAGNILINDNDELEIKYPVVTNDIINEENLKDINVNFGEVFGPINKVIIYDKKNKLNYIAQENLNNLEEKINQIKILNNQFINKSNGDIISQNILNKLSGLYYSINDFTTTGVCYYDYLDLFDVEVKNVSYKCLLLNNEIVIEQGINENIFNEKKDNFDSDEVNSYENINISNKEIQQEIDTLDNNKTNNENIIETINKSKEENKIKLNKINLNIDFGICVLNSNDSVFVNFSKNFNTIPQVILTPYTDTAGIISPKIKNITASGFSAILGGTNLNNISCSWFAISK